MTAKIDSLKVWGFWLILILSQLPLGAHAAKMPWQTDPRPVQEQIHELCSSYRDDRPIRTWFIPFLESVSFGYGTKADTQLMIPALFQSGVSPLTFTGLKVVSRSDGLLLPNVYYRILSYPYLAEELETCFGKGSPKIEEFKSDLIFRAWRTHVYVVSAWIAGAIYAEALIIGLRTGFTVVRGGSILAYGLSERVALWTFQRLMATASSLALTTKFFSWMLKGSAYAAAFRWTVGTLASGALLQSLFTRSNRDAANESVFSKRCESGEALSQIEASELFQLKEVGAIDLKQQCISRLEKILIFEPLNRFKSGEKLGLDSLQRLWVNRESLLKRGEMSVVDQNRIEDAINALQLAEDAS